MSYLSSHRLAIVLLAAAAIAGLHSEAVAQDEPVSSRAAARSPFLGRWELDLTRMPSTYGPPPKRVVYDFQDIGDGRWRTTIDITAPDDSVRHVAVAYRPDGSMVPGEGDKSEADSAAIMIPAPNVLVMNLAKNGMPGSVRVYTVSPKGKEMTESAAAFADKGGPFVRNFHYKHLP